MTPHDLIVIGAGGGAFVRAVSAARSGVRRAVARSR